MKKQIIITLILLAATAYLSVVYFKNLNPPGARTGLAMRAIPDDASLIFEFNNDKGFYDIFKDNHLFASVIGKQKLDDLNLLKNLFLENPVLRPFFAGQNIFISLHPLKANGIDLLLTTSSINALEPSAFDQLSKQINSGLLITPLRTGGKPGFNIYISSIKKRFYIINKGDNIFSGSFSKELIDLSASNKNINNKQTFVLLSEQQSNNSLANLYVNYSKLSPLFNQLLNNKNADVFKNLSTLPALAVLSQNYKSDAIMFNGSTTVQNNNVFNYINLLAGQQPVTNHLKDIFPSTTAYSTNYSVSDPLKFEMSLSAWYSKAVIINEKYKLINKLKAGPGIKLKNEFDKLLGNEFAIITTRYFEKYGIVTVKDGSKLKSVLNAFSTMIDENKGQLNYEEMPFLLLGDAFSIFKKPYFLIIDNYLIFANSAAEIISYYDTYINRKFLSKNEQYNKFDDILSRQSNVSLFFNFKNAQPILERELYPEIYQEYRSSLPGWKNFYALSLQLSTADKNLYTNLCVKLNSDTAVKRSK